MPPLDSGNSEIQQRFQKALVLQDQGHIDEAICEFRRLAARVSNANEKAALMLNEAKCYAMLHRLGDASRLVDEMWRLRPDDAEIRMNVAFVGARILALRNEHQRAARQYCDILQEYAELLADAEHRNVYEQIYLLKAIELANSGDFPNAITDLTKALSFPTVSSEDRQEAHLYLGICFTETQEEDLAKREFLRVISFNLHNEFEVQAHYRIAVQYFTRGAFAQAKHHLETILESYKTVALAIPLKDVYEQLSRACLYLGETENAGYYNRLSRES